MSRPGEPYLHLAGFRLWVSGYQYRDANGYWDGNWLNATAICGTNGQGSARRDDSGPKKAEGPVEV